MSQDLTTPKQIQPYDDRYRADAWKDYSPLELAAWVHLFRKRANQRTDPRKREKDTTDADNYLSMLMAHYDDYQDPAGTALQVVSIVGAMLEVAQ